MNNLTSTNGQINTVINKNPDEVDISDKTAIIGAIRNSLPYVMEGRGGANKYILLTELSAELDEWISTGKTEKLEFKAMPEGMEQKFKSMCARYGYTVISGRQKMSYMNHDADIVYIGAKEPESGAIVALLPWFMVPRKKYPVFVYLYADSYRQERKSGVREAASAAAELFGVVLHYSTVSRSKGLGGPPLGANEDTPMEPAARISLDEIIASVHGMLSKAAGSGKKRAKRSRSAQSEASARRGRERGPELPADSRTGGATSTKSVGGKKLSDAAKQYISSCRSHVLNAATQSHRFLL